MPPARLLLCLLCAAFALRPLQAAAPLLCPQRVQHHCAHLAAGAR
jgi:hypothetical protein